MDKDRERFTGVEEQNPLSETHRVFSFPPTCNARIAMVIFLVRSVFLPTLIALGMSLISCEDLVEDVAVDVGEAAVDAAMADA